MNMFHHLDQEINVFTTPEGAHAPFQTVFTPGGKRYSNLHHLRYDSSSQIGFGCTRTSSKWNYRIIQCIVFWETDLDLSSIFFTYCVTVVIVQLSYLNYLNLSFLACEMGEIKPYIRYAKKINVIVHLKYLTLCLTSSFFVPFLFL